MSEIYWVKFLRLVSFRAVFRRVFSFALCKTAISDKRTRFWFVPLYTLQHSQQSTFARNGNIKKQNWFSFSKDMLQRENCLQYCCLKEKKRKLIKWEQNRELRCRQRIFMCQFVEANNTNRTRAKLTTRKSKIAKICRNEIAKWKRTNKWQCFLQVKNVPNVYKKFIEFIESSKCTNKC